MTKGEWSGWMQAVGSVLAILGAIGIAWWQHKRDLLREERKEFDAKIAQHNGVLQMITAVAQLALKLEKHCDGSEVCMPISGEDGKPGKPTVLGLEVICTELDTAVSAIARTDLLPLANYRLIQAMQVAQSSGSVTVQVVREQLTYTDANNLQWHVPRDVAKLCSKSVIKLGDEIFEHMKLMRTGNYVTVPVKSA